MAEAFEVNQFNTTIHFLHDFTQIPDINKNETIILVDGVINTGKSISKVLTHYSNQHILIAANVISNQVTSNLNKYKVFATRTSENFYVGSESKTINHGKGPDTSSRLFKSNFFKQ
ncbi:MAG: hypothetical protein ACLFRI_07975 [Candidatus Izemoplasmataceae bacterium]